MHDQLISGRFLRFQQFASLGKTSLTHSNYI